MKKKKLTIGTVLNNNNYALIFSVIVAIILWLIVAMNFSDQQIATFGEIPVQIDTTMTQKLDLQMFGQTEFKVTVNVSGKRYEVSPAALSNEDFVVTASTVNVSSAGKYSLPITVRPKEGVRNVEIVSYSPETVDVYFDYNLTENYPVEVQLNSKDNLIAAKGFIDGEPILSTAEVTVSGAAAEVQKIARVVAKINITSPLTKTEKFSNVDLSILNQNGGIVRSAYVSVADGIQNVTVTVPIFKVMDFKPTVRFKNSPSFFLEHPISYSCQPFGTVNAAVSTELLSSAESLSLGTIDFSKINAGSNSFTFRTEDIANIRVLDDIDEFRVDFTLEGFQSKTMEVPRSNITINGLPRGRTVTPTGEDTFEITVIGSAKELELIKPDSIHITADASSVQPNATTAKLPLSFTIDGVVSSWIYGSYWMTAQIS